MAPKLSEKRISLFWIVMILIAGLLIIGDLNRRMSDARRLERDAEILEGQVAAKSTERADLMTRVAAATSEEAVAEWAHADAKLVREGEVLVVPLAPSDEVPLAEDGEQTFPEVPSKFQVWWALLFGK
jgi:cell division protein FtsB